jgi:hypothetical protein
MKLRSFVTLLVFLTMVGVSGCATPAATPAPAASGPVQVTLTTNPNPAVSSGETELVIEVKDDAGKAVSGATVQVSVDMLSHSMGAMEGPATDQGNGRYATKVPFGMAGDWVVTVEVRQGDTILATQEVTLPVQPAPSTGAARPQLVVDQDRIDFGAVPVCQMVEASFKLTNAGDQPLTLAVPPVAKVAEGC